MRHWDRNDCWDEVYSKGRIKKSKTIQAFSVGVGGGGSPAIKLFLPKKGVFLGKTTSFTLFLKLRMEKMS